MSEPTFYRGGPNLAPRRFEVKLDAASGMVRPLRGVSVSTRPDGLERFGGVFVVGKLPPELKVIQVGRDSHHHEIVPVTPMSFDEYADFLSRVALSPV